jgi:hypothetical protein
MDRNPKPIAQSPPRPVRRVVGGVLHPRYRSPLQRQPLGDWRVEPAVSGAARCSDQARTERRTAKWAELHGRGSISPAISSRQPGPAIPSSIASAMRSARSKLPLIEPPTCATRSRGLRISPSACDTRRRPSTSYRDLGAALSSEITPDQIRSELSTVLSWGDFATSPQLARFLQHVVNQSLGGREAMLKERNIALHALGRAPR